MKKFRIVLTLIFSILMLVSCGNNSTNDTKTEVDTEEKESMVESEGTIKVGCSPQYMDILTFAKEDFKALSGMELEPVMFNDYVQPNTALYERSLDANVYQFLSFLNAYNESNDSDLVMYGDKGVFATPYGLYSEKITSLNEIKEGMIVGVGNDKSNRGLALRLLEEQGLIKLGEYKDLPTLLDITENPYNFDIVEIGSTNEIVSTLPDLDIGVTTGITMHLAEKDATSALATGSKDLLSETALIMVVNEDRKEEEWTKYLYESLTNDNMKQFLADNYAGALILVK